MHLDGGESRGDQRLADQQLRHRSVHRDTAHAAEATWTSSNTSSPSGAVRKPIFSNLAPAENPGVPRSTRNAVTPPWNPFLASVTAKTITRSASGAFEMKVFVPLIRNPSPSAT